MLLQWFSLVKLTADSVSENYGHYVEWVVEEACAKFQENQNLVYKQGEVTQVPVGFEKYDNRFKLGLIKVVPSRIAGIAMRENLNSISILEKL